MADRKARRQQGWSALTHAQRENPLPHGPLLPSFSRELPAPDPSQFTPLSLHSHSPSPTRGPSFSGVLKQKIEAHSAINPVPLVKGEMGPANNTPLPSRGCHTRDCSYGYEAIEPSDPHSLAVPRLHALHSWADTTIISDILQALDLDEDSTSAYLVSMASDNMERISASNDAERPSSSQGNDDKGELACATEEISLVVDVELVELSVDAGGENSLSAVMSVPIEPEWEEDDIYLSSRRDALRMSRASGKHARGAYKAFMGGDYSKAKALSKQAREERVEAEKLHAEAAKQILQVRNGETPRNLWHLDLHGLHVNEAIAALRQRLSKIETSSFNPDYVQDVPTSQRSTEKSRPLQGFALHGELKVITGVGNHSRGGGSLPMAIQSFLIQNRYKFEESKPGVVAVRPKFQFLKDR